MKNPTLIKKLVLLEIGSSACHFTKAHGKKNKHEFQNHKNEWYFNILEYILQLLKETKEHHDRHFSEKEVNCISNCDYAACALCYIMAECGNAEKVWFYKVTNSILKF